MSHTVMAVDDSASVRQMVCFTLRQAGYEVIEAGNGREALERIVAAVRLVITDLNMPEVDGIELVKRIRSGPAPAKYVPIVLLTTESQDVKKQEAKAAGATGWITKPFRPEQLLAVVKRVLG
jgi:two-component system, chemotaxis family, chemotaxis protein CheY